MTAYKKTMREALQEVSSYKVKEEMDPRDHVTKEGDKFVVKSIDGKITQEFMSKDEADEYAIKNHDKLMATEEVELDEAKYTRKLMKDKSVVDYVKSQQARNRKKEQGYEHGANWVDIAADAIGMDKMSLSKKKAFDWDSEYEAVAKKLGEEVELDETTKFSNADFMLGFLVPWAMNPTTKYEPHLVNYVKKLIPANNREYAYKMIAQQLIKLIQGGMPAIKNFARQNKGAYDKMDKDVKKHLMKGMKEEAELDEGKMSQLHQLMKDGKSAKEIAKIMKLDVKTIKALVGESAGADARRAMRGDPDMRQKAFSKDDSASDDDRKAASKNIMMQMRKAQSLKGRFDVEFQDGKKMKVPTKIAMAVQQKYNSFRKPADKEKFQAQVGKSYKDMLAALKEGFASDAQRRAAFASGYKEKGKKKKESTLERMNKKIQEKKNG